MWRDTTVRRQFEEEASAFTHKVEVLTKNLANKEKECHVQTIILCWVVCLVLWMLEDCHWCHDSCWRFVICNSVGHVVNATRPLYIQHPMFHFWCIVHVGYLLVIIKIWFIALIWLNTDACCQVYGLGLCKFYLISLSLQWLWEVLQKEIANLGHLGTIYFMSWCSSRQEW